MDTESIISNDEAQYVLRVIIHPFLLSLLLSIQSAYAYIGESTQNWAKFWQNRVLILPYISSSLYGLIPAYILLKCPLLITPDWKSMNATCMISIGAVDECMHFLKYVKMSYYLVCLYLTYVSCIWQFCSNASHSNIVNLLGVVQLGINVGAVMELASSDLEKFIQSRSTRMSGSQNQVVAF